MSDIVQWPEPGAPFRIEYSQAAMEALRERARDGLHALPRIGMGVGGVLLGHSGNGKVVLLGSEPFECLHARGPAFALTAEESVEFRELIASSRGPHEVIGWYCSRPRGEADLAADGRAFFDELFPGTREICLVIKPSIYEPFEFAFLFRNNGRIVRGEVVELPLWLPASEDLPADFPAERPAEAPEPARPVATVEAPGAHSDAAPTPVSGPLQAELPLGSTESSLPAETPVEPQPSLGLRSGTLFGVPLNEPAPEAPASEPAAGPQPLALKPDRLAKKLRIREKTLEREKPSEAESPVEATPASAVGSILFSSVAASSPAPEPKPAPVPPGTYLDPKTLERRKSRQKAGSRDWLGWLLAAAALIAVLAAVVITQFPMAQYLVLNLVSPPPSLVMSAAEHDGAVQLHWNKEALRGVGRGTLFLNDGGEQKTIDFDARQLQMGEYSFTHKSERVSASLNAGKSRSLAQWFAPPVAPPVALPEAPAAAEPAAAVPPPLKARKP